MMGGLSPGLEMIVTPGIEGGLKDVGDPQKTVSRAVEDALIDAGIVPPSWKEEGGPSPPASWETEATILISLPEEYGRAEGWIIPKDLPAALAMGSTVVRIMSEAGPDAEVWYEAQPTITEPPVEEKPTSIEELASGEAVRGTEPRATGAGVLSDLQWTLDLLNRLPRSWGWLGDAMSWIDDIADIVGTVGDVLTAPIGTQGTVIERLMGGAGRAPTVWGQPRTTPVVYDGGWGGWDMPGVDVGRQGAVSRRGGPFYETENNIRTRRILQHVHPVTGRIVWYRNMGRPILWSGDRSTVRRWNRNVGPQRRVGVSRRRKR